jgi:hypothetical protein
LRTISFTHLLPTARAVLDRILGLHFHLLANRDAVVAAVIAPGLPDRAQLGVVLLEDSLFIAAHTAGGLGVGALLLAEKAYRHFKQRMHFLYGVYERRRREGVTGSINHLLLFLSVPIGVRKGGGRPERFLSLRVEQVVGGMGVAAGRDTDLLNSQWGGEVIAGGCWSGMLWAQTDVERRR